VALVFLVLAHRDPEQVARLVGRLGADGSTVLLHVDRKVDIAPFAATLARLPRPPVLVEPRVTCHWGGFGHVAATLRGMAAALRLAPDLTHLALLTGQDYPLRPLADVHARLAAAPGRSYLSWSLGEGRDIGDDERNRSERWLWSGDLARLRRWHVRVPPMGIPRLQAVGGYVPLPPIEHAGLLARLRPIPEGLVPAQGLAYWTLSRAAVAYCLDVLGRRRDVLRFFRGAFIPEENIFQMLLLASPLADTLVNDDQRYVRWDGAHPHVLRTRDLDALQASGKLFARKFDRHVDARILDLLDAAG
jgi:hypothetical protein